LKTIQSDQRGSILPMFAVVVAVIFMVAAVAVDFGRYVLATEKLQTAADSASTAAALTAKRYVLLEIDPGQSRGCCDDGKGGCRPCCKYDCGDPFTIEGPEEDLVGKRGYRRYCCSCHCRATILDRWVEYEDHGAAAGAAAEAFFNLNKPREMDVAAGGEAEIRSLNIRGKRGDPLYPSVIVTVQGRLKTRMMNFIDRLNPAANLSDLEATRCSQGGSFYYGLEGNLTRAAQEGCE